MKYIEKYYQKFMNENQKIQYSDLKKKRVEVLKSDPGDWEGGDICSYSEAKNSNPELFKWYVLKSKINHRVWTVEEEIRDLELQLIEDMEEKICQPGNLIIYRNPGSPYNKTLSFLIMEQSGRDNYLLFNNINSRIYKVHWKSIVKNYKLSKISE